MSSDPRAARLARFLDNPRRAVWTLALPMMGGMLFHAAYSVLNTAFVGRLGPESLAAITFVGPVFFVGMALAEGLSSGVTAVIAQAVGRGDHGEADRAAVNALGLGVAIGVLLLVTVQLVGDPLLRVLGAEGGTVDQAWAYFQLLVFGVPLFFVTASLRAVLTGEGDSRTPMYVLAAATGMNAILDPIYIFVLDLGIRGAALATLTGQVFSLSVLGWLLFVRRANPLSLRGGRWKPEPVLLRRILGIGIPTASAQLVMAAGMMLGNKLLASFGQATVAGFGAASRVDMLVAMPIIGLAGGAVSLVGMFAGANRLDLVRSTTLYTYRWALILTGGLGVLAWLASGHVMSLFTDDPQAWAVGREYLGYMVFAYPLMAVGMTSGRILQGLGRGVPSLVITSLRLGTSMGLAWFGVLAFAWPLHGVWLSYIAGGLLSVGVGLLWIRQVVWRSDPTLRAAARPTALAPKPGGA